MLWDEVAEKNVVILVVWKPICLAELYHDGSLFGTFAAGYAFQSEQVWSEGWTPIIDYLFGL